ncbi:MAG: hypothetical protein GY708_02435 [Actinomycetia bacterium]|nr:hypothetical protein [Actinomycetes bacterium]MCP4961259.1 hypothetical protein [Actinomycetes bacterium]
MTARVGDAKTAVWLPGWYNLDQSIVVGQSNDFVVYTELPDLTHVAWLRQTPDIVFYNSLLQPDSWTRLALKVLSINHPEIGALSAVRTERFGVYEFEAANRTYEVEAEEGPGVCWDTSVSVPSWGVLVEVVEEPAPSR